VGEERTNKDVVVARCRRRCSPLIPLFVLAALFSTYALQSTSSGEEALFASVDHGDSVSGTATPDKEAVPFVFQATVKKGETLTSLLGEWLSPREIDLLDRQSREVFSLRRIRQGRPYLVRTLDDAFQSFEYEIDCDEKLVIRAEPEGFVISREPIVYQVETVLVCGTIRTSLFDAADEIGEIPVLALRLVDIFGWDVDFVLDVRAGDSFKAVVEKRYRNGEFAGYGSISAAEFINQGTTYQGFLFENKEGHPEYYDAKGRSLRRTFLKTPLDYARISSGFTYHRFHPIKKKWCPHPAIDYAAPVGTPVRTVGDGVVLEAGRNNAGGGNFVAIRHNSMYETYYSHLSRFAKGVRKGKRVHQGQVIGYVGNTGMSTGPHLDFRMKKNGRYVNPRRVIAPASPPVPRERIEAFRLTVDPLLARLDAAQIPIAMETSERLPEPDGEKRSRGQGDRSKLEGRGGL
jgi:murein DD-endopeptidase MepM/ murein hydrolase activator NlpD